LTSLRRPNQAAQNGAALSRIFSPDPIPAGTCPATGIVPSGIASRVRPTRCHSSNLGKNVQFLGKVSLAICSLYVVSHRNDAYMQAAGGDKGIRYPVMDL
jgi:hypothetical protein